MRIILGAVSLASAIILTTTSCNQSPPLPNRAAKEVPTRYGPEFWEDWGDGYAEVSTYQLVIPRYGEAREGESILIFVSETMSERQRVKADPGRNPKADEFPVMKLNWLKNFQTGIYDYSEMTSSFLGLGPKAGRPAGMLAKTSFSRQEWCGHMFAQALYDASKVRISGSSYFDGDSDLGQTVPYQAEGLSEDALPFWVRGMAGPVLQPGESKSVPFLTSLRSSRDAHQPMAWSRINLTRSLTVQKLESGAGEFEVETFSAQLANNKGFVYFVEKDAPHRIIRWQFTSGEAAELVASDRVKYWELNMPGGVEALRSLGLEPRAPRFSPEE